MPNKEFQVGDTVYEFPDSYDDAKVQGILSKQGVIKPPTKKDDGLSLGGVGKAFLKQGVGMLKTAGEQVENIADIGTLGLKPKLEKTIPALGKARQQRQELETRKGAEEETGSKILQGAEWFAPIPGVSSIKAGANAGRLVRLGATALRGGLDAGVKTAVQTGDVKAGAEAGAVGGAVGAAVEAGSGPIANVL